MRWAPTKPKHLDYVNAQVLMVGESSGLEKATEPQKKDQKAGKEAPLEEMERLEDEDTRRMQHLSEDDSTAVFADLEAKAKEFPSLQTTW